MLRSRRTIRSRRRSMTPLLVAAALTLTAALEIRAQARTPACALLSVAEVRQITGYPGYGDHVSGSPPGEGAGGGSSCQYRAPAFAVDASGNPITPPKGPLVSLVLIEGKGWTALVRRMKLPPGCKWEPVAGVGDEAYFEVCPSSPDRTSPLYVKAGAKDLIVQIDIEAPDTEATMRPKVIALAKAAVAKLR